MKKREKIVFTALAVSIAVIIFCGSFQSTNIQEIFASTVCLIIGISVLGMIPMAVERFSDTRIATIKRIASATSCLAVFCLFGGYGLEGLFPINLHWLKMIGLGTFVLFGFAGILYVLMQGKEPEYLEQDK